MWLGMNDVIMANHMISLITSATTDLSFAPSYRYVSAPTRDMSVKGDKY